jgi:PadR family transcriptional regulator
MAHQRQDVLQGTLDLLILRVLAREAMHGYGIMQRLHDLTEGVFDVTPGSLFPSLQRLEEKGWIAGDWGTSENNRRARFYSITKGGRKQLRHEERQWSAITAAVARVLQNA